MHTKHFYLIRIQYLGYRLHGWLLQPEHKTVQLMINKTVNYVLGHDRFKTLGSSRTDAMVSANHMAFELFLQEPINTEEFLIDFNKNLPQDVKALSIEEVSGDFNIIQHPKIKEYLYLFSFGEKMHPFAAPFMTGIQDDLDIEIMQKGAVLFEGKHDFINYIHKPKAETQTVRTIEVSEIIENQMYQANFFPEKSFVYRIKGKGFGRYQIRLMMGQLIKLGQHQISIEQLKQSLLKVNDEPFDYIAPPSGLILEKMDFE